MPNQLEFPFVKEVTKELFKPLISEDRVILSKKIVSTSNLSRIFIYLGKLVGEHCPELMDLPNETEEEFEFWLDQVLGKLPPIETIKFLKIMKDLGYALPPS